MKNYLFALAAMVSMGAAAQNADITLKGFQGKTIYIASMGDSQLKDSVKVTQDPQVYKSPLKEAGHLAFFMNDDAGSLANIISDATPITITLKGDKGEISGGSDLNAKFQDVVKRIRERDAVYNKTVAEYQAAMEKYQQNLPDTLKKRIETTILEWNHGNEPFYTQLLQENKDNLIPLLIMPMAMQHTQLQYIEQYLADYKFAEHPSLASIKKQIQADKAKRPGTPVTDVVMNDLNDKPVHLTDWVGKGNYVLVDFWASWCGPCRAEMPNVKAAYYRYHSKGFEIVGISLDSKKDAWVKAVKDLGIPWPQMSDLKYWQSEAAALYNVRAIPATILFDPEGKVVCADLRGEALAKKLAEIYDK